MSILFVFLDGVGLAPPGPDNPLSTVPMPHLRELLGGPLVLDGVVQIANLHYSALDACLGVPGLPQSATGQTALFTGLNAPALVGDHVSAHPTAPLRERHRRAQPAETRCRGGRAGALCQRPLGALLASWWRRVNCAWAPRR